MRYKRAKRKFVRNRVYDFTIEDNYDNCTICKSRNELSFRYQSKTVLFREIHSKMRYYGFGYAFWLAHDIALRKGLTFSYRLKEL